MAARKTSDAGVFFLNELAVVREGSVLPFVAIASPVTARRCASIVRYALCGGDCTDFFDLCD